MLLVSPAVEAGLADPVWSSEELVGPLEQKEPRGGGMKLSAAVISPVSWQTRNRRRD